MFARFNFKLEKFDLTTDSILYEERYYRYGQELFEKHKQNVCKSLDEYLSVDGILQADIVEKTWFPLVKAQLFFSHSHYDEDKLICLAGYLAHEFGLISFIDSIVWNYADDLLKQIDDTYCKKSYIFLNNKKVYAKKLYQYDMRNRSTAHVHMILQGALAKMINQTECIIFINTPSSLNVTDMASNESTSSPWIYNELLMTSTFPPRIPDRYADIREGKAYDSALHEGKKPSLQFNYPIPLGEFKELKLNDFQKAKEIVMKERKSVELEVRDENFPLKILDQLYINKGIVKKDKYTVLE